MRLTVLLVCFALALGACDRGTAAPETKPSPAGAGESSPAPVPSPSSTPDLALRLKNEATGESRRLLGRAIEDLRRLGYWKRLTDHLYSVWITVRPPSSEVPDDHYLAHSLVQPFAVGRHLGERCHINFYADAMQDETEQITEDAVGAGTEPSPDLVQTVWTSILAHERSHCLPYETKAGARVGGPEPRARKWEKRVANRLIAEIEGGR